MYAAWSWNENCSPFLNIGNLGGLVMTRDDWSYMVFVVAAVLVLTTLASWVFLESIS